MASLYARAIVRLRWLVLAAWAAVAVGAGFYLPTLDQAGGSTNVGGRGGFRGLVDPDSPAIQAEIRSFEKFRLPLLARVAVVQRDPQGLRPLTQVQAVADALAFNFDKPPQLQDIAAAVAITNAVPLSPAWQERSTAAVTYLFFEPKVSFARQTRLAHAYARHYLGDADDHLVGVTGVVPGRLTQLRLLKERLALVEMITVAIVFLVVAIAFRAFLAPVVAIASAGLALFVTFRSAAWFGERAGFSVPSELEAVMVALILGVVTDYTIFFLSGMRERLAQGDDRLESARKSTTEFAPIVLVAGVTVAVGTLALLVAKVELFRSFGPGMAFTVAVGLAVAITVVPASMAILGGALFWPSRPRRAPAAELRSGGRDDAALVPGRLVKTVTGSRRGAFVVAAVGIGVLVMAAIPLTRLELGLAIVRSLPASSEPARAEVAATKGFSPGILSPTVILIEAPGITEQRESLARLEGLIERTPGVVGVIGPREQPTATSLGAVLSPGGNAARLVVTMGSDPLGATAIDTLTELRSQMSDLLRRAGLVGARVSFAGDTALAEAVVAQTGDDLIRIALTAAAIDLLVLMVFLRALVAPVYLLASSVLAVAAALGLTSVLFEGVLDQDGVTFYVPFAAAVLLVALGSDYNIFGVGYIWSEARHRPLRQAIRVAVPRSTHAITAAGMALALSFAVLALVPLSPLREFAFAMSVGILLDAFVVRSVLVPSLVALFGRLSAWPRRLLGIEPAPPLPRPVPARGPAALPAGAPVAQERPLIAGSRRAALARRAWESRRGLAVLSAGVALGLAGLGKRRRAQAKRPRRGGRRRRGGSA